MGVEEKSAMFVCVRACTRARMCVWALPLWMTVMMTACDCVASVWLNRGKKKRRSYHAVHRKVVVLGLQLDSVLVVAPDLCVTGEEKPLVVHDPVEHLHARGSEEKNKG